MPWTPTHVNHPCSKWVRESKENYQWTIEHGLALAREYTKRYEKIHASQAVIELASKIVPKNFAKTGLTPFAIAIAIAIADTFYHVPNDPVTSYRSYYVGEKSRFAKWTPRASPPLWWPWKE